MYRAVDQHGQVIDVYVSVRRDIAAARTFLAAALSAYGEPDEVVTDLAHALEHVIEELVPIAFHKPSTTRTSGSSVTTDAVKPGCGHARNEDRPVIIRGHAFMQNIRRGHYELGTDARNLRLRVAAAFDKLAGSDLIASSPQSANTARRGRTTQQRRGMSSCRSLTDQAA